MVKFEFSSLFFLLTLFYFKLEKNIVKNMLTLSGGGGDCCNPPPPPLWIFPCTFFAKIAFRSISPPVENIFQK